MQNYSLAYALNYWECLDRAKNSVKIEELRIVNDDSEKIVISRLVRG
jgi:hypothetical protein